MFKFYDIPNYEIAEKIIGNKPTIKFSSAFDLNDPFELKFNLQIDHLAKGQEDEYFKNFPNKTSSDFKEWQKQINHNFLWYTEQKQRNDLSQIITLSCFTEKNQNNLMWSHYTKNHQGICVKYSNELVKRFKSLDNFLANGDVQYSEKPPLINNLEKIESKIIKMLFNKQSEWKYEKEHRIILHSKNNVDFIEIDPKFIKAVYIGSKCETALSREIVTKCVRNGIKVYHGITVGKTYKVEFQKHKPNIMPMKSFWK